MYFMINMIGNSWIGTTPPNIVDCLNFQIIARTITVTNLVLSGKTQNANQNFINSSAGSLSNKQEVTAG
jgi:hypothetical protein